MYGNLLSTKVSIHASVKDATKALDFDRIYIRVSIHASVKDATKSIIFIDTHIGVSIHASVKDATLVGVKSAPLLLSFNPRICKRCDWRRRYQCRFYPCFNPRICKRCDHSHARQPHRKDRFNPRICKRCDRGAGDGDCASCVSIHASVKDATDIIDLSIHSNEFQSTHL